jgi:hypothetical protein
MTKFLVLTQNTIVPELLNEKGMIADIPPVLEKEGKGE